MASTVVVGDLNDQYTLSVLSALPQSAFEDATAEGVVLRINGQVYDGFPSIVNHLGGDSKLIAMAAAHEFNKLDDYLLTRTFLEGKTLSQTDLLVFGILYKEIPEIKDKALLDLSCLLRWFNHVQHIRCASPHFPMIAIKTVIEAPTNAKDKKQKKAKAPEVATSNDAAVFDIRVGRVVEVAGHDTDERLYVEKIDLGESTGPRQVVSGLAKHVPIEGMRQRLVCVLVNIEPCEIKGTASSGLVLCASNADRSTIEPLRPPSNAQVGEKVAFAGTDGIAPEAVLKKRKLDKLWKLLKTNDSAVATCAGVPFTTSAGPVTVDTLRNAQIK
ncbi:tRNA-binding domain-containing protein [Plasmodiophora brassicae]